MKVQKANFANSFYSGSIDELNSLFQNYQQNDDVEVALNKTIIGGIVPHAGYVYSGRVAAKFYRQLAIKKEQVETYVVLNPNHSGFGNGRFNLSDVEAWETPFGNILIDEEFELELAISSNNYAHCKEHSGEVQLPFLKYFGAPNAKLVMITINQQNFETASILSNMLYLAAQKLNRKIQVIASSDFSHFETAEVGFQKDQLVVDAMLDFNIEKIEKVVQENNISVCGFGAIMTLLAFAKLVNGNAKLKLLDRDHSGSVHFSSKVVDYISAIVF